MFDIQGLPPSLTEYSLHAKRPLWLIDNQTAQQGHRAEENIIGLGCFTLKSRLHVKSCLVKQCMKYIEEV